MERPTVIIVVVLAIAIAVAGCRAAGRRDEQKRESRIGALAAQRADYVFYVGVPVRAPTRWARASSVRGERLVVDGSELAMADIDLFVVTYPNGQIVDARYGTLGVPDGATWLESNGRVDAMLRPEDWASGARFVKVAHGRRETTASGKSIYPTTLTNVSSKRVRIERFAAYRETPDGWKIHTVTGAYYSAEEFRSWYGAGAWLQAGESVTDANNYGGSGALWAYEGTTEDGEKFIAAAIAP